MPKSTKSNKSKKIKSPGLAKKPLMVLVAVLFIAVGVAAVMQTYAAQTDIKICNSDASKSLSPSGNWIEAYKTDRTWSDRLYATGECSKWVNNTGTNPVRVNTNSWTGSYKLGKISGPGFNGGYGDCHEGTNWDSNPPNDAPYGVRYIVFKYNKCQNDHRIY